MKQSEPGEAQIRRWMMAFGMILLGVGGVCTALVLSWYWPWGHREAITTLMKWGLVASVAALVLGPVLMLVGGWQRGALDEDLKGEAFKRRHSRLFNNHLAGLGFALLIVALATAITAAGFIRQGWIGVTGKSFNAPAEQPAAEGSATSGQPGAAGEQPGTVPPEPTGEEPAAAGGSAEPGQGSEAGATLPQEAGSATTGPAEGPAKAAEAKTQEQESKAAETARARSAQETRTGMILLFSTEMSLLGALFFLSNRLRERRKKFEKGQKSLNGKQAGAQVDDQTEKDWEEFIPGKFWGGLFFRIGEAVLFTFVFFLLFWKYGEGDYTLLPVLALFLGMFVKTGEKVVFGLGERMLAGASQLFPLPGGEGEKPPSGGSPPPAGGGQPPAGDAEPPAGEAEPPEGEAEPQSGDVGQPHD